MDVKLILIAFFVVRFVDVGSGQTNILLEDPKTGNMVAHWDNDFKHKPGDVAYLKIEAECTKVYEVLEGNGKRGSPWRAEDDWYVNRRPYICNALKVEDVSTNK